MLKTIGVLTFHRAVNYGSYWQARALVQGLRDRGHRIVVLDHRSRRVTRAEWRNAFQPVRPRRTAREDIPRYGLKARRILGAVERLPLSAPFDLDRPETMAPVDTVVVGSDEVWNFRHPWYAACPLFFGVGVEARRLVAYAGSFGGHQREQGLDVDWARRLERFDAISVRDSNSADLVRGGLGRDAAIVLDPCLQFEAGQAPAPEPHGDVVVYGHDFPDALVRPVRAWARERRLHLVSIGYRNDWADEQRIDAGPDGFARAMAGARAVVTNFFHGCVFAVLNGKPFVCATSEYRSRKIEDLLRLLALEERLAGADTSRTCIDDLLERPPGAGLGRRLVELRSASSAYLDHALA